MTARARAILTLAAAFAGRASGAGELATGCAPIGLAGGGLHSAAIHCGSGVCAWGWNFYGQLGDGSTLGSTLPVRALDPGDIVALRGGGNHSLAITAAGELWAWGDNSQGALGQGTTTASSVPLRVPGPTGVIAAGAGYYHSLALLSNGRVWSWGGNDWGQLGDGTWTASPWPKVIAGITGVIRIAGGGFHHHNLVVRGDATAWSWGYNSFGQLGTGSAADSNVPVPVSGLVGVTGVATGSEHSLALLQDGSVWAFGLNQDGQLGDGSTVLYSLLPVRSSLGVPAAAIAGAGGTSLALAVDGSVWAWGSGAGGQLGNGGTASSRVPVRVPGLANVVQLSGGTQHVLAVTADGTLWAWGDNGFGQLGDGTTTTRLVPTAIPFDEVPGDLGNSLRLAWRGDDLFGWFAAAAARDWRVYRDLAKDALGRTALPPDLDSPSFLDPGARLRGGVEFYRVSGLSACSLTPGP